MRRKNDILLKCDPAIRCFRRSIPRPVTLLFFFNDADDIFDIEKGFDFLDKELNELLPEPQKQGGGRVADMLMKTFLKSGDEDIGAPGNTRTWYG